ncbi:RNA polymerase sigma factor [Fodinibius halophilus]|uniref:RNA polymerase sigma-70 factor n=1 Tax=Fodinibius halophilus TaxID=1736908 RepID=A0A6M1TLC6_9BACT|nr:RNA polymerase sigma-70 factor [Fodinibius halophilus]NGP89250.1 RNA polymerase sigma-70 factor [Fodinibius halophilus]
MSVDNSESLLIKKIREGDEYAFEIVFLKYYSPMCKYIWKYVRSEALAKEIVQEVFATVWETRSDLDPSGHLRGLLYEMARNKALDYIKHQKIVDQYLEERRKENRKDTVEHIKVDEDPIRERDVEQAIDALPHKARLVYKLNREEGLTYKEIAKYLEISIKTVESRMRRVFQILRDRLSKYSPIFILVCLFVEA